MEFKNVNAEKPVRLKKILEISGLPRTTISACGFTFHALERLEAITRLLIQIEEAEAVYKQEELVLVDSGRVWTRSRSNLFTRLARATFSQVIPLCEKIWKISGGSPSRGCLTLYFLHSILCRPPYFHPGAFLRTAGRLVSDRPLEPIPTTV